MMPELSTHKLFRSSLHAVHVQRNRIGSTLVPTPAPNATFMIASHLREMPGGDLWRNGHHLRAAPIQTGGIRIYDQREAWLKDVSTPFESVNFFIPLDAFAELTEEQKAPTIDSLSFLNGIGDVDPVLENLARALRPGMAKPSEVNRLFADHIFAAVRLHVAVTYGGVKRFDAPRRGTLSMSQERRVRDRVFSDLTDDPSLSELASLCGLSRSHFTRAFKNTIGLPPHRWLLMQRIERAKSLLAQTVISISQIAIECGFADQSHFTRVFSKATGTGPAAWRRLHC
jgi:AraC family transcriptional regulator